MKIFLQRYKVLLVVFLGILFLPLSLSAQTVKLNESECLNQAIERKRMNKPFKKVAIFAVSEHGSVDNNQNPDSKDTVVKCVFSENEEYATWEEFKATDWKYKVVAASFKADRMYAWTEIYIENGFSNEKFFSVSHGNKYSHYFLIFKNNEGIKIDDNFLNQVYFYFDKLGYYKKSGDIEEGEFPGRKRYVVKKMGNAFNYAYIYFMGFKDDIIYDDLTVPSTPSPYASSYNTSSYNTSSHTKSSYLDKYKKPDGYEGPLPDCAFDGSCADVNKLLELVINIGKWFFSIIGSLAFVFFVYGGFTMILSFGSAEKFKKGQQVLVAAVIGMIIAFGAYALVNFLLTSLGVSDSFIFVK
ncbi:MAG: pilin [Patescibacteria group bacterium]